MILCSLRVKSKQENSVILESSKEFPPKYINILAELSFVPLIHPHFHYHHLYILDPSHVDKTQPPE